MTEITRQIAGLSPEKRKLLEMLLMEDGLDVTRAAILPQRRETNKYPLSFAQQRLWFLDQLEHGSPIYNIPTAVRLTGRLNIAALQNSLNGVIRRHEILRTTFITEADQPLQVIAPELVLTIEVVDLSSLSEYKKGAEVTRLSSENAHFIFDLAEGPLLKPAVLRLSESEHIFLLTIHHIIADGWSIGVLINEITAFYNMQDAKSQPVGDPPLPELTIQYADYAVWQRNWLQGEVLENQLAYWKKQLGDEIPVLALPTDRPRPPVMSTRGATRSFELSNSLSDKLQALCRQEDVTTFMLLLAAFQILLFRYAVQEDISVGSPIANRNRGEVEGLIGFFANTLVLRTAMSGDPSFRELLKRVKEITVGAYDHQDIPFEMLVEILHTERDMSYSPLFQVMFSTQKATTQVKQLAGLTMSMLATHSGTSTFDLTLLMVEGPKRLQGSFEYNVDLFDAATIERIISHFKTLLEGIIEDPDCSIATLPLLINSEVAQQVEGWNDTWAETVEERCIHELIEEQVEREPEAIAVQYQEEQLSYQELNYRSNQLAHYLGELGVGPERLVGICLERSLELVIGILGVLKAGGAYLPLDPAYPQKRLEGMVKDSGVEMILSHNRLKGGLIGLGAEVVSLDTEWEEIGKCKGTNPEVGVTAEDLAYVIYTSGSTGQPKGVMITHRGVVNHNQAVQKAFQISRGDRVLQFATVNFDTAAEEIFPTLESGAKLVMRPEGEIPSGSELVEWIEKEGLTVVDLPTAYWHTWVNELLQTGEPIPASLRLVVVGGEKANREYYTSWRGQVGGEVKWINTYGPTEATIIASLYDPGKSQEREGREIPIGRPIANVRLYILDRKLQPQPIGAMGELWIGGAGVGRGYLKRPELTAEKFMPDPFMAGGRMYKTGDLARYRPDGNIEYLGRVDQQAKVRGFRVELGEVEAALSSHPGVRECVVVALDEKTGDNNISGSKRLVAYIVPVSGEGLSTSELRHWVKQKLPEFMTPSAFKLLEALPLTPNGKLDRRALPAPEQFDREVESAYIPPRTSEEEILASIWSQLLKIDRVGINDNFFDLGGHSLLATQVISRVRAIFKVELPLRNLFETPTVAGLAKSVRIAQLTSQGLQVSPILPLPRDGNMPLSFAQQRLWFIDQFEPGIVLYNIPSAIRFTGKLSLEALKRSLNEIVRRHEILRTTYATIDGRAIQVIAPELEISIPVVDLENLSEVEREAEAHRLAIQEPLQPFNLSKGPLLRLLLIKLSEQEHIILLTMHHIVFDGWSTNVLLREVAVLYQAYVAGENPALPELPIQYADFARWQRQWLQGEILEKQLEYWKKQLSGSPPMLELPTDRPRPEIQSSRGAHFTFSLPKALSHLVNGLCLRSNVTPFMFMMAAFQVLLYRYTGQDDICVGTPEANRNRPEIEELIGFFVNTLVIRTDLSGKPTFLELLERVRETALEAYAHQDLPFEKLVDAIQPERNLGRSPLFQVMLLFQNAARQSFELPGLVLSQLEIDPDVSMFDLTLVLNNDPGGFLGGFEYNVDLFNEATIERMAWHFRTLLESIIEAPERPISSLELLTDAEKRQLVLDWNQTHVDFPQDLCIHNLFEAQAESTPEAIALVFRDQRLTYQELNRRANQLAHYLSRLGVGPGTLVGLCMDRSLEMAIGLLGVLKTGGAYLPLDPSYPTERLAFMVNDSMAPVLLTQKHLMNRLPAQTMNVVCLDSDWQAICLEDDKNYFSSVTSGNVAYVIYTSGSTGEPKGVMVPHRCVVNHNLAVVDHFQLKSTDRVLQFSTINFDAAVEEIFPTWSVGATVVLRYDDMLVTGENLLSLVENEGVTVLDLPTAYWHEWVYELTLLNVPLPKTLRLLVVGGEKVSSERLATWLKILSAKDVAWINTYGPTEATIIATFNKLDLEAGEASGETASIIGKPIHNVQAYIFDRNLQMVPVGVAGELHIGGSGVADGYLGRPGLTAEKFIPNPFHPGERLYKTGDLVRYRAGGTIEFLGRVDYQVKVRGFRIEPGEIETVLIQHPGIRQAVVVTRQEPGGAARLVAYVVPVEPPGPGITELQNYLGGRLPEYMRPSAFVTLDALPITPGGKIDRQNLPTLGQNRPELESAYLAPQTNEEVILARIWGEVLGLQRVGVNDNFFQSGGDSILSIQVVARANQAGLKLSPRQLFEAQTISELARVASLGQTIQVEQGLVIGSLPLTPIQRWFFEQQFPEPHHWNQAVLLELKQAINRDMLQEAIYQLMEHHDALRLRFEQVGGTWQQESIGIDDNIPVEWEDLSILDREAQRNAIQTKVDQAQASLDLSKGPILRVVYFFLGKGNPGRLLMVIHHLAVDGVSWRIIWEDFQTIYNQISKGGKIQLPPKTSSYQFWASQLTEYARTESAEQELAYWLEVTGGTPDQLPVDHHNGPNDEASARTVRVELGEDETKALLHTVPAAYGTEINDALLCALALTYREWTGSDSLLVELEGHGREEILDGVDLSRTVGWFTSLFPVKLTVGRKLGPGEALKAVKECLRAIPKRGIGYGVLRYLGRPEIPEKLKDCHTAQVGYNYLGQLDQVMKEGSSLFGIAPEGSGMTHSDKGKRGYILEVNGGIAAGHLQLEWTYSENIHRHETIEGLARQYMDFLRRLIEHCQSAGAGGYTPSDFPLADLDQTKLDKMLARLNKSKKGV